jgi:uncharacterized protein YyaL (SSP411 family)
MSKQRRAGWMAVLALVSRCDAGQLAENLETTQTPTLHMASAAAPSLHTNRLAQEKSPYLLQHQHNPVDWYPWGDAAFAQARQQNKPIFLSIGYSTCHWCHVMERESFENETVAAYLNEHFVSIKVDREERPDIDKIYMMSVQAISGQGGWPLSVFLTPDLKPFYGGTYFPSESRHGLPGFLQLLQQIHQVWVNRNQDLTHSAAELHHRLALLTKSESAHGMVLTPSILHDAAAQFKEEYDAQNGGFGNAPKFPRPSQPALLLAYGMKFRDQDAVDMVLFTCEKMAAGGIHDQLGGGFARYSVDDHWLVPHFEKMLYDNAQLVQLYLDAYLASGDVHHAHVARDILRYVLRDMTHAEGGFFSAEDADSEGKEGKFYCWTRAELSGLLTPEEFNVAVRYFGITEQGNFVDHSDPHPLPNQNVLSVAHPDLLAADEPLLAAAEKKMAAARARRIRPHLDDKVLASWNGMMLGALARAYAVLDEESYRVAAEKNLAFIQANLWDASTRTLYHRWRGGERDQVQLLDAYAFLLAGVIDLYEATLEPKHLDFAIALAQTMLRQFYDAEHGGFWQSPADAAHLILRVKEDYDGAEPSGNSVAALALLKLAAITDTADFKKAAEQTLRLYGSRLAKMPQVMPYMLLALNYWLEEPTRVAIAGDPHAPATRALLHAAYGVYQANRVVLGTQGAVEPFAKKLTLDQGQPTAYVCLGTSCRPPTSDPLKLKQLLQGP